MKKGRLFVLAILAFGIVLLILNPREADDYEFGTLTPPAKGSNVGADDFAFQRIFPEFKFTHACAGCGECVHPFEVVENRRILTMHDHDGWYKLFWAADEDYYYTDPIHMLADYDRNRTAETPTGTWTIRVRAGAATHRSAPAHECGQIPREMTVTYRLVSSADPLDETFHSGDGPMKFVRTFSWLTINPVKPTSLGWEMVGSPVVDAAPCPCALR